MAEWRTETVGDCLDPLSLGAITKIQSKDYKSSGRYPIVDQGQGQIAGWTNDDSGLIALGFPVVVFGDHTRAFKYIDFPFVRGADGTQVLRPRSDIDPFFFYYALRAIDLPSRGYNRHFKELKESRISIAPNHEQRQIAQVLVAVEDLCCLQDQQLTTLSLSKRATMRTLFTFGLRGEARKETDIGLVPESWGTPTIAESVRPFRFERGRQIPRSAYLETGRWPIVDQGQQQIAGFTDDPEKIITPESPLIIFGDHTRIFKFVDFPFALGADGTKPLLPGDEFVPKFLFHALTNLDVPKRGYNRHYIVLSGMRVPRPTLEEQHEILIILDTIDRKVDLHKKKRAVLDELFKKLLHKLMTGEIRVADLDLSALDKRAPAEAA